MNNAATALLRIAALAGGAVIGALLARLVDDYMMSQSQEEQPDYEKLRYAQGLSPITPQQTKEAPDIYTLNELQQHDEYFG